MNKQEAIHLTPDWRKQVKNFYETSFEKGIKSATELFKIKPHAYRHDKQRVIETAIKLFTTFNTDDEVYSRPVINLMTIALADEWLSTSSHQEKRSVLDTFKTALVIPKKDLEQETLAYRVRKRAAIGIKKDSFFDPSWHDESNPLTEYVNRINNYIYENENPEKSAQVESEMKRWGTGTPLDHARKKLGITPLTEQQFSIVLLDKTSKEIKKKLGFAGLTDKSRKLILIGSDLKEFEHEYAHTQGGINFGCSGTLLRGLDEAITEKCTKEPKNYSHQRSILDQLFSISPQLEELTFKAYTGEFKSKIGMFSKIIDIVGMEGFLALTRLSPYNFYQNKKPLPLFDGFENVFLPHQTVKAVIDKKITKS